MVHCDGEKVQVTYKIPVLMGVFVGQTDTTIMQSSHIALLPIPPLSLAVHRINILPVINDRCLMSVGQLCDYGFVINFDATHIYLLKGKLLRIGTR